MLRSLLPGEPEVVGLLALLLLTDARRESRFAHGELVPLDQQDRSGWDPALVAEGHDLVRACLARERATGQPPGRYQLLAAINAVHTDAREARDTDWSQVAALYDQLVRLDPSPIVRLNRAVAIAELDGPAVALAEVDRLPLEGYHAWHATRADLLRRLGRAAEARAAYDAAIAATGNAAEQAWLGPAARPAGPLTAAVVRPGPGGRVPRPAEETDADPPLSPPPPRRTIAIYRRQSKNIAKHREESWDTDSGATSGVAPDRDTDRDGAARRGWADRRGRRGTGAGRGRRRGWPACSGWCSRSRRAGRGSSAVTSARRSSTSWRWSRSTATR